MGKRKLILDYGIGSVEYTHVKKFEIKFPYIFIDGIEISLEDVKYVRWKDFIAWRNERIDECNTGK